MTGENVILVDEQDNPSGIAEKLSAHEDGLLHRAFSVFIFNMKGEMLLQRRALEKYHSGGLWTNAVCSHPGPGEETGDAVSRRMMEELGIKTPVKKIFDFIYRAELANGLTEYEFDHVYAGEYEGKVDPNPSEVMEIKYLPVGSIRKMLSAQPGNFTAWFQIAFPRVELWWERHYNDREVNR